MSEQLLQRVAPPALPQPPSGPLNAFLSVLNNILRLYFNANANVVNSLAGHLGGRFLDVPNALFYSTADQALGVINTAQPIQFENTYLNHGVTINGGSSTQITTTYSGVYNFQVSAQVRSNSASSKIVFIWISRNGTDIGYSTKEYVLSGSGDIHELNWSFNMDMQAGQYIEMQWAGDDIDLSLDAVAAASPHPGIPSAAVAVSLVSALPDTLPTPP